MRMFTILTVAKPFQMKREGARGRWVQARVGDKFVTTSVVYSNSTTVRIHRERGARIGLGCLFDLSAVSEYFVIDNGQ